MMQKLIELGRAIYNTGNSRELHRMIVFNIRGAYHQRGMRQLYDFFMADGTRRQVLEKNPLPMEQVTRSFFYKGANFSERLRLIEGHMRFLQARLQPAWVVRLSTGALYEVWRSDYEGVPWEAVLAFEPGQRKEGMLSLQLNLGRDHLYQIMFWLGENEAGEPSLWIGALQGPNMADARELIKKITKRSFSYRTKNLILYMLMAVARSLAVQRIYAVTNEGYYANNHVRRDRKLKTDFSEFWAEAGGKPTGDDRFYELPLVEPRKSMEEVPTRKRAVYRRRFAFLDDVDAMIGARMEKILL